MRILGFEITRSKPKMLTAVSSSGGGWFRVIQESFSGAWQRHIAVDSPSDILAFSAVFSCVTRIASDIAKLRVKLVEEDAVGICTEIRTGAPWLPVLRKPNGYQNRIQFFAQWIISKLLYGNTYVLKVRDLRTIVTELYILDPQRVTPLVAENGDVYYKLAADNLSGLTEEITVPASEIIHDRMNCLWHPLVGVSPIYACGKSATQGNRIQANSTQFFDNMSRPSGMLTAPGAISDEVATRLKATWEENFSGKNLGRLAVLGDNLKYEAMTIPANEAQLIEQLRWTAEDVARCFGVPFFKIGGPPPPNNTIEALNQVYYSDCLQSLIESLELCLDEGLDLKPTYYTELDLEGLLRMDTAAQIEALSKAVLAGIMAPDEARAKRNLPAVPGGKYPYLQQQNYSLEALAKRDALEDPFAIVPKRATDKLPTPAVPEEEADEVDAMARLRDTVTRGLYDELDQYPVDDPDAAARFIADMNLFAEQQRITA